MKPLLLSERTSNVTPTASMISMTLSVKSSAKWEGHFGETARVSQLDWPNGGGHHGNHSVFQQWRPNLTVKGEKNERDQVDRSRTVNGGGLPI